MNDLTVKITRASNSRDESIALVAVKDFYNFLELLRGETRCDRFIVDFDSFDDEYDVMVMIYDSFVE